MKINEKSTRHSKAIGEFGEHLIWNLLSRSGLEVARVDHTGIDLLAFDHLAGKLLGISVKSRTRSSRQDSEVRLFDSTDGQQILEKACTAFRAEPWLGVYVETEKGADLYLTSLKHYRGKYGTYSEGGRASWKMSKIAKDKYKEDRDIVHVNFTFEDSNWKWDDGDVEGGQKASQ